MLAVNQFRQPLGRCEVEIPAGKLSGEDPLEAAKRELQEETGYSCGSIRKLHSFYTSRDLQMRSFTYIWQRIWSAAT